jgi:hypothetical protein
LTQKEMKDSVKSIFSHVSEYVIVKRNVDLASVSYEDENW